MYLIEIRDVDFHLHQKAKNQFKIYNMNIGVQQPQRKFYEKKSEGVLTGSHFS